MSLAAYVSETNKQNLLMLEAIEKPWRGGGGTPHNGLYGEAPPESSNFLRLRVYERVRISLVERYEWVGNLSFRSVTDDLKGIFWLWKGHDHLLILW